LDKWARFAAGEISLTGCCAEILMIESSGNLFFGKIKEKAKGY